MGNIERLIAFYNSEVDRFKNRTKKEQELSVIDFINKDPKLISWTSSLIPKLLRGTKTSLQPEKTFQALHRPFSKEYLYFGEYLVHRRGQFEQFHPVPYELENYTIFLTGVGVSSSFTTLITNQLTDGQFIQNCQCFPLYYYEEREKNSPSLFDGEGQSEYVRRDGVSDFILERGQKQYGKNVTKEDLFYYVYGFLHSPEYRTTFANDLKKMLPRLPLVEDVRDFWRFSKAGRLLAELHVNYESVPPYEGVTVTGAESGHYRVEKMRFPKKGQTDTIIYNSRITISGIPVKAYQYQVNGKSAIEWIMERYQVKVDKASGIKNDPNDWADEVGKPSYVLDLLLSIINVSVQTVDIVNGLPKVEFE